MMEYTERFESPVIEGYGKVVNFKDAYLQPDITKEYKAVFSIEDNKDPKAVSDHLLHVALLLNILNVSGIPKENIKVAVVISGKGTDTTLNNDVYRKLHGQDNPNLGIEKQLVDNGVELFVCGQSIAQLGFEEKDLNDYILFSLSALTDLLVLQQKGYLLLP